MMARSTSAESLRFVLQAVALSAGLCLLALLPAWKWGSSAVFRGILYGCLLSLFLISSGFAAIRWAFHRPAKIFYGVVMGGMFARFVIIGICLVLVRRAENVHIYGFVGAVMTSYVILQILEVRFIKGELPSRAASRKKIINGRHRGSAAFIQNYDLKIRDRFFSPTSTRTPRHRACGRRSRRPS